MGREENAENSEIIWLLNSSEKTHSVYVIL